MRKMQRQVSPNQLALWSVADILAVTAEARSKASRNLYGTRAPVSAVSARFAQGKRGRLARLALAWLEC